MDVQCDCGFCKPRGPLSRRAKLTLLLVAILSCVATGVVVLAFGMR